MRRSQSVDERARQQCDLVRKQKRELDRQAELHARARAALEAAQALEAVELKRSHTAQLVDLWQQQGRTLGPWTAPVLEGKPPRGSNQEGKVGHG